MYRAAKTLVSTQATGLLGVSEYLRRARWRELSSVCVHACMLAEQSPHQPWRKEAEEERCYVFPPTAL